LDRVVIDTNVFAGALLGGTGYNRRVIRACLSGRLKPLMGQALFLEYEDERQELFAAFLSVCEWVQIYFSWRPNLPDEADNHIVELAVAGGAAMIVTNNLRDFQGANLRFPDLRMVAPRELVKELP
jgi:predicted nucleic acid-binding protein